MSSGPAATLDTRPAVPLPPNIPSCGNQPAYISLDHASSNDTRATHRTDRPTEAAPGQPVRTPLHPALLTKRPTYQLYQVLAVLAACQTAMFSYVTVIATPRAVGLVGIGTNETTPLP